MSADPPSAMRRLMLPVLAVSMIASAAFIAGTVDRLPAEVASHFGGVGANGWMAHDEYLWWMLGLALVVPGVVVLLIAVLPRVAPGLVNLPHRAYWLADERRDDTLASLLAFGCWQGCVLTAFAAGLHYLLLQANAVTPPRLPGVLFAVLLAALVAAMLAWTGALYARFRSMR